MASLFPRGFTRRYRFSLLLAVAFALFVLLHYLFALPTLSLASGRGIASPYYGDASQALSKASNTLPKHVVPALKPVVEHVQQAIAPPPSPPSDRITLIVIWTGLSIPSYVSIFLASVRANAKSLDLIFVAKHDPDTRKCVDIKEHLGSNIKFVCLSDAAYWELHVDYLDKAWGTITDYELDDVRELVLRRGRDDYIHSHFRMLRGGVFKKYFIDNTAFWGWCDLDTVLGDYATQFPWDIAHNYDIIATSRVRMNSEAQPDFLMFMSGHMTIFQNRPSTFTKFLTFPSFVSAQAYLSSPKPVTVMEEEDFSTYFFYNNTDTTFLMFDGLIDNHFKAASLSPRLGVFQSETPLDVSIPRPPPTGMQPHTFSDEWLLAEGEVELVRGGTKRSLWFPLEKAVSYVPLPVGPDLWARRFVMRNEPNGKVIERVENLKRSKLADHSFEALYIHLQEEKRTPAFKTIPFDALSDGKLLQIEGFEDIKIWKGTDLIFSTQDPKQR